jgi:hypothetical protein
MELAPAPVILVFQAHFAINVHLDMVDQLVKHAQAIVAMVHAVKESMAQDYVFAIKAGVEPTVLNVLLDIMIKIVKLVQIVILAFVSLDYKGMVHVFAIKAGVDPHVINVLLDIMDPIVIHAI